MKKANNKISKLEYDKDGRGLAGLAKALTMSVIVTFILFCFELDAHKSIWAGTFIFIFYGFFIPFFKSEGFKEFTDREYSKLFPTELIAIVMLSLILLLFTHFASGVISHFLVNYCEKDSIFYDERQCAIQSAMESINDKYSVEDNPNDF
jgi:hypothetical protein